MLRWKIRGSHPGSKVPRSHGQTFSMCPCTQQRDHSAHGGVGGGGRLGKVANDLSVMFFACT